MATISLCMIVKNESAVLRRCLDSLAGLMDELIIVDTGSEDDTKKTAAEYTDRIYDFKWTGSFADARNFSFSKAHMDYIYCADADEVIDEENRKKFLALKEKLLPEIEIVQMYYCNQLQYGTIYNFDKEYRPKLYKRVRTFRWEEAVHEAVALQPVVYDSDIEIMHLPQGEHAGRDLEAFERITASGERLSERLHTIYAKELFIAGRDENFARAVPFFERTMEREDSAPGMLEEAECVLVKAARLAGGGDALLKSALKNVAGEGCSEVCFELGQYFLDRDDAKEAAIWFYNAAYETKPVLNIHYGGDYPLQGLSECWRRLGSREQAEYYKKEAQGWQI